MDTTADTTASDDFASAPGASNDSKKGNGALQKATTSAHATIDKVAAAADKALQQAKPALDKVTQVAHGTIERAAGVAVPTATWLNDKGTRLKSTQEKFYEDTCSYVAANPLKAIAMSVIAGFLLGKILR